MTLCCSSGDLAEAGDPEENGVADRNLEVIVWRQCPHRGLDPMSGHGQTQGLV